MPQIVIAAFYKFSDLNDHARYREPLTTLGLQAGVAGTILLAPEGINGTIAGPRAGINQMLAALRALPGCADINHKESHAEENPFYRLKVRLKKEIVTLGRPDANPNRAVGTYVEPVDWNSLIDDPDIILIDTRNDYEVKIGTFERAENPQTKTFREFAAWFEQNRARLDGRKVAMFCTGGIRCEKATSLLRQAGIEDVFHLKGGILKYLEIVPPEKSRWQGECFVFDQRVSVKQGLEIGQYDQCHACRMPISEEEKRSPVYEPGISCPHCHDQLDSGQKERFAERQRQIELARARGEQHVGRRLEPKTEGHPLAAPITEDNLHEPLTDEGA